MRFDKIIKQATDACLPRIEAEHAARVTEAVAEAVDKEWKRMGVKVENREAALDQAAKEITRYKSRLDKLKAEIKEKTISMERRMDELRIKNQKLQENLDTAREQARAFGKK